MNWKRHAKYNRLTCLLKNYFLEGTIGKQQNIFIAQVKCTKQTNADLLLCFWADRVELPGVERLQVCAHILLPQHGVRDVLDNLNNI